MTFADIGTAITLENGIAAVAALIMIILSAQGVLWVGKQLLYFMQEGELEFVKCAEEDAVDQMWKDSMTDDEWSDFVENNKDYF